MSSRKPFGVLAKDIEIIPCKDGKIEMSVEEIDAGSNHVIKFYPRARKQYNIRGIENSHNTVFVVTLIGQEPSKMGMKVVRFLKISKGELLWSSGVCSLPDDFVGKYKDAYDLEPGDCAWEAIMGVPTDVSEQAIKEEIKKMDKEDTIRAIIFDVVMKGS